MTDDSIRSVVHLAVGVRCAVVVADVQACIDVVEIANIRIEGITVVVRVQRRAVGRTVGAPETRDRVDIGAKVLATHVQHVSNYDIIVRNKAGFDQLRASSRSIGSPNGVVGVGRSSLDREVEVVIA